MSFYEVIITFLLVSLIFGFLIFGLITTVPRIRDFEENVDIGYSYLMLSYRIYYLLRSQVSPYEKFTVIIDGKGIESIRNTMFFDKDGFHFINKISDYKYYMRLSPGITENLIFEIDSVNKLKSGEITLKYDSLKGNFNLGPIKIRMVREYFPEILQNGG